MSLVDVGSLATWEASRDTGIAPTNMSVLGGSESVREELLYGASILGLGLESDRGVKALAPQQLLLADVLESPPAGQSAVLLPRRSSKSTTLNALALGRCALREDYRVGLLTLSTGKAGRSRFLKDVAPKVDRKWPSRESSVRAFKAAGGERVEFRDNGSIAAWLSSVDDLRGERFDWVILDEAGEADPEKAEEALAAALPTLDTAPDGQITAAGTAGRYREGNLLWQFLESGRNGIAGILEYAAPESTSLEQLESWELTAPLVAAHHPGVNTLTTLGVIERNWRAMKPEDFMREYLGIFGLEGLSKSIIKPDQWGRLADSGELPEMPGRFAVALSVHRDQIASAFVAAWRDGNGRPHVLVLAHERGVSWVKAKGRELWDKHRFPVIHDTTGPVLAETEQLGKDRVGLLPQTTRNITTAAALLLKEIETERLVHHDQPGLNEAARIAVKRRILGSWGFGADGDITPLEAASMALRVYDQDRDRVKLRPNF